MRARRPCIYIITQITPTDFPNGSTKPHASLSSLPRLTTSKAQQELRLHTEVNTGSV
jgi:hypothetical protein